MAALFLVRFLVATGMLALSSTSERCRLRSPLDLGRTLGPDSIAANVPFTPGNVREEPGPNGFMLRDNDFCTGEHIGTHLDAPFHFNVNGWKVADIPLERLITNGVFMNFSKETGGDIGFRLEPEHIDRWIEEHGRFPKNAMVLISFGWAQLYSNRTAFTGTTSQNFFDFQYPGVSEATAQKLAAMDEVVGIGVDTVSGDPSGEGTAHVEMTRRNKYIVEGVDLDQPCLPARGFKVFAMPMKLLYGTGAPTRLIVVPNSLWQ